MDTWVCTACGEEKPLTKEFFYKAHSKRGFSPECKECTKIRSRRNWREQMDREKIEREKRLPPIPAGMKRCAICNNIKEFDDELFSIHRGRLTDICRDCTRQKRRQQYHADPERELVKSRIRMSQWQRDNPERTYTRTQEWRTRNRKAVNANAKAVRAQEKGILVKPEACEVCGKKTELLHHHHKDYDKPLEVEWLCPMCHRRRHTS